MKMKLCDLISILLLVASLFCGICAAVIYSQNAKDDSMALSLWGFSVEAFMGFAMLAAIGVIICCCCKRSMA